MLLLKSFHSSDSVFLRSMEGCVPSEIHSGVPANQTVIVCESRFEIFLKCVVSFGCLKVFYGKGKPQIPQGNIVFRGFIISVTDTLMISSLYHMWFWSFFRLIFRHSVFHNHHTIWKSVVTLCLRFDII